MRDRFRRGDPVIFRKFKHSTHPGPRARAVHPAPQGEDYTYEVDKFWVVADVRPDGQLVVQTRQGKTHVLASNDPNLRHARWWERLVYHSRFPRLDSQSATPSPAS